MNHATLASVLDELRRRLAGLLGWGEVKLQVGPEATGGDRGADAVLVLPTPNGEVRLAVEVKQELTPGRSRVTAEQARAFADTVEADGAMVVAPWLSPRTRRELTVAGVCWADLTGNVRLQLSDPPLLVATQGADRNPAPKPRGMRGLGGPRAVEVVRALTELDPPFTLTELVDAIGRIDPTYVMRILRGLAEAGLVDRDPRGPVTRVDVAGVVERWVEDYSVLQDHLPRRYMLLGGPLRFLERLRDVGEPQRRELRVTITGSLVAYQVAPVLEPVTAMAYTTSPDEVAAALGLIEADAGANVVLLVPNNPVVLKRPWQVGGVEAVIPVVAAADLLSSGGRAVDEAAALLTWATEHPDRWRCPPDRP